MDAGPGLRRAVVKGTAALLYSVRNGLPRDRFLIGWRVAPAVERGHPILILEVTLNGGSGSSGASLSIMALSRTMSCEFPPARIDEPVGDLADREARPLRQGLLLGLVRVRVG